MFPSIVTKGCHTEIGTTKRNEELESSGDDFGKLRAQISLQ